MAAAVDTEALLREQPFAPQLVLEGVEPVGEHAHSGTACFVRDAEGRRFKVRGCAAAKRAAEIQRVLAAGEGLFPRVVARSGSLLLLEALDGFRPLTREELIERLPDVGEMVARTHQLARELGIPNPVRRAFASAKARYQFERDIRELSGIVESETLRALSTKFRVHRKHFGLPVALELDDIHKANLMVSEEGALRFVDEEAVAVRPLGIGLASMVKTAGREVHWHAFREGYARVAPPDFLTPEYTEYVVLQDTVRKVAFKVRAARALHAERLEKLPDELEDLREVARRTEPSLEWGFGRGA